MNHGRLLHSSTFRLALFYTVLSLGTMLILLGFIYWATAGYMNREINATIDEEILGLAEQYENQGPQGLAAIIEERVALDTASVAVYLLADTNFRPIVGNLDNWPAGTAGPGDWLRFPLKNRDHAHTAEHLARARSFILPGNLHLLVGRDIHNLEATRQLILEALGWGAAVTLVLALGVGLLMSSRVMRRIEAINQTSREIMEGDLSRRVDSNGSGDEYDQLAGNLNRMFERIEALMEAVRQVSDNIAHDLRTPLTRLRTRLEQCRDSGPEASRAEIDQAIADAEELLTTFNALLRIARIESGKHSPTFSRLDIAGLLRDIAELYEPVAANKGQNLRIEGEAAVPLDGDRDLLFQALANLVDNAIKYTPAGGAITLSATRSSTGTEVQVTDTGPGIPPALGDRVFQRFYRSDSSRSTPGSGLGLSLVRAIVDIHDAQIELADNAPGLRVTIKF